MLQSVYERSLEAPTMKKRSFRLLALIIAVLMTLGCLAQAEEAPEAAEVVEVVEAPVEEAPEVEPESEEAPEAKSVDEVAAEEPEISAEEGEEAPAEEGPATEEPEAVPEESVEPEEEPVEAGEPASEESADPEEEPANPEESLADLEATPEEEGPAEEAPTEEGEDEDEEIVEEADYAVPEGLVIENGVVTKYDGTAEVLVIPSGVTRIGDWVFYDKRNLKIVTLPDSVTSIGSFAFKECHDLKSINIPDNVTSIGDYAFQWCYQLTDVRIPGSVTSIGEFAFYNCGLATVNIESGVISIGDSAFRYCVNLTSVNIPDSVTSIGGGAFDGCSRLMSARIGNGVASIGQNAFSDCGNLTSVNDGNNVTSIGDCAFQNCSSLTGINIPDSVTSIGDRAFQACNSLKSARIGNGVTSIGHFAFCDCGSLTSVNDGNNVTSIGDCAFQNCSSLNIISIPDSVTRIGHSAFENCGSLSKVSLGNGLTSIGDRAFLGCTSLPNVDLPDSVTSIGENAFYGCSSLTEINIPNSVTSLGGGAFGDCSSLMSASIGNGVIQIENYLFDLCVNLKKVVLGTRVTRIYFAFYGCNSLTQILIPKSVTGINSDAFIDCPDLTIYGYSGSYAQTFAQEYDIPFVVIGLPEVIGVSVSDTTVPAKQEVIFTVLTDMDANYITMYAEKGNAVKTWTANGNSIIFSSNRLWTVKYAIANKGSRQLTFKASVDGSDYGEGKTAPPLTVTDALPAVTSVSANVSSIEAKKDVTFTVKTPATAKYLALYDEKDRKVTHWTKTGNSTESGSVRTWTVKYAINSPGDRVLTFKCSTNGTYGEGKSVSLTVTSVASTTPDVISASANISTTPAKQEVTFTVMTPSSANYVALYSESTVKVKTWEKDDNSYVSGNVRIWTLKYAINTTGQRVLTFKCSINNYAYGWGKTVSLKVTAPLPAVTSVTASPTTVAARQEVTFTVKTPSTAKYLAMFSENGSKVKVWGMTGNSTVSGTTRIWTVKYAIASKGNRVLTFKCSTNGTYGAVKTVNVTVK